MKSESIEVYDLTQPSHKQSLLISSSSYKKLLRANLKHDSCFDIKNFLKGDNQELLDGLLVPEMLCKRIPETLLVQLPYPVNKPKRYVKDYCEELIQKKLEYVKEHNHYVRLHKKTSLPNIDDITQLPQYVLNMLNSHKKDPDPYLKVNYNAYYTGGNLNQLSINNRLYLVHALEGSTIGFFNCKALNYEYLLDLNDIIYGINVCKSNDEMLTTVRQKYALKVLKTHTEDGVNVDIIWSDSTDTAPYVDFKINQYDTSNAFQLKANENAFLCNLQSGKKFNLKIEGDYFQCDYLDARNVFMISPKAIMIYDTRSFIDRLEIQHEKELSCDSLSTFTLCEDNNYVWVSSTHNIRKIDLRTMKSVNTCSHLLSQPPLLSRNLKYLDNKMVIASGTACHERFLYIDNGLCQRLPNLNETYHKMLLRNGPSLKDKLDERLKISTTGLTIIQEDDDLQLYTCNSIGDLFCNRISKEPLDNEEPISRLSSWVEAIPENADPLKVTDIRPLNKVKNVLNKTIDERRIERYIGGNPRLKAFHNLYIASNNLALMEIWDDDDDEEEELEIDANDKVQNWLDSSVMEIIDD